MKKIGLISDTHGWWDEKYAEYFAECDEIWHAGDIGSADVAMRLTAVRPLRAVYGNIDGYPGRYDPAIRAELYAARPRVFVCGHSHILRVMYDKHLECLCLNPGAAGISGFHTVRTLLRFAIDGTEVRDMEVIELGNRSGSVKR